MTLLRRRPSGDEGVTLVELIVAIAILAVAAVVMLAAMTSIQLNAEEHRGQATVDTVTRDYAEALKLRSQSQAYVTCPPKASFASSGYTPPAGYTVSVTGVEYWIPNSSNPPVSGSWSAKDNVSACTNYLAAHCSGSGSLKECDPGLQRLTLDVTGPSSHGTISATSQILLRRGNT